MFMINWQNKLDIGDVNIEVREDYSWNEYEMKEIAQRELVVGYKSIYINVYSVFVINIQTGCLAFRHESFCLWETKVSSFLNSLSFDFISMQHQGLQVLALGNNQSK
jgi:hypothetical protein